ncbi:MAG: GldG family protein [Clostridia bacterium]|nr:GldG family protein [Clostridia bacterium]
MNENEKKEFAPEVEETLTEEVIEEAVEAAEEAAEVVEEAAEDVAEETAAEEDAEDAALAAAILENGGKEKKPKKEKKSAKAKKPFNKRKFRFGSMATVLTVVVVVALVLVSVIGDLLNDRFPVNLDLTAEKTYTFSENSEKVAELVNQDVEIVVFMAEDTFKSPNNGNEIDVVFKQFYEFTNRYESLTDGKVKTLYLDPTNNPTVYSPYEEYGIEDQYSFLMRTEDRYRVISLSDLYESEYDYYNYTETITGSKVENVLASNLQYLCRQEVTTVTILVGHDEYEGAVTGVTEVLEANGYEVTQQDYTSAKELPETTKALVIAAPSKDFSADEIKRMRTWLNNDDAYGRHLMVLLHPTADCPNLYDFLKEEYFIEVADNVVVETDLSNVFAGYSSPSYYTFADLEDSDYSADLSGRLIFPTSRQIIPLRENNTDYAEYVVPLVSFSDSAKLNPIAREDEKNEDVSTEEEDTFTDTEKAELVDPDGTAYGALMSVYDSYNNDLQQSVSSYVLVSGSADFLTSGWRNYTSNAVNEAFFLNTVNTVLGNENSIVISTRSLESETLEFDGVVSLVVGLGVFTVGIPVVMLIICLVVFIKRRHL